MDQEQSSLKRLVKGLVSHPLNRTTLYLTLQCTVNNVQCEVSSVQCTVYSVQDSTDLYCSQHQTRNWQIRGTINTDISRFEDPGNVSCVLQTWRMPGGLVPGGRWPGSPCRAGMAAGSPG